MPELTDRRVLVAGGAGFVGRHLVDALHADNDVRVLDDPRRPTLGAQIAE